VFQPPLSPALSPPCGERERGRVMRGYQVSLPVPLECSPQEDLKPAGKLEVL
jgi:hypothetical protein